MITSKEFMEVFHPRIISIEQRIKELEDEVKKLKKEKSAVCAQVFN